MTNFPLRFQNLHSKKSFERLSQVNGTYLKEIDLKGYSAGVYNLSLMTNEGMFDKRIVIE